MQRDLNSGLCSLEVSYSISTEQPDATGWLTSACLHIAIAHFTLTLLFIIFRLRIVTHATYNQVKRNIQDFNSNQEVIFQ